MRHGRGVMLGCSARGSIPQAPMRLYLTEDFTRSVALRRSRRNASPEHSRTLTTPQPCDMVNSRLSSICAAGFLRCGGSAFAQSHLLWREEERVRRSRAQPWDRCSGRLYFERIDRSSAHVQSSKWRLSMVIFFSAFHANDVRGKDRSGSGHRLATSASVQERLRLMTVYGIRHE